jgi:hypothetical protein
VSTSFTNVSAAALNAAFHMRGGLDETVEVPSSPLAASGLPAPSSVRWIDDEPESRHDHRASVSHRRAVRSESSRIHVAPQIGESPAKVPACRAERSRLFAIKKLQKRIVEAADALADGELLELADPIGYIAKMIGTSAAFVAVTLIWDSKATRRARKAQLLLIDGADDAASECYASTMAEYAEGMAA